MVTHHDGKERTLRCGKNNGGSLVARCILNLNSAILCRCHWLMCISKCLRRPRSSRTVVIVLLVLLILFVLFVLLVDRLFVVVHPVA